MSSKIKVLHIINNLNIGGAEKLLLQITTGLVSTYDNYEIMVLTLDSNAPLTQKFLDYNIAVKSLDVMTKSVFVKIVKILKVMCKFKPDIVHTHIFSSDRAGLISAFLCGVKLRFSTIHNMEPSTTRQEKLTRIITSLLATKMISVSESAREYSKQIKEYNHKKVVTIYNAPGFNPKGISPKKFPDNKKIIKLVSVARIHIQKGQTYLVDAMKILNKKHNNLELTIYGTDRGGYIKTLEKKIEESGVGNIKLAGFAENIEDVLKDADIFVSASLWEGLPLSVIEAMVMAVPMVITDIEPHRELFANLPDYPYLPKPKSPEDLTQKIELLLKSKEDYERYSELILRESKKFSVDTMVNNYHKFYQSFIKQLII